MGVANADVVLLAVELPVIVALIEVEEEAPTEPRRRLTLVELDSRDVDEEEAFAAAIVVAKRATDPLTLVFVEYEM